MTNIKTHFLWLFFMAHGLFAQSESNYPELSGSGSCIEELIPLGWQILSQAEGDLNGDGLADLVFAIQSPLQETIEYSDGYESDTLHINPRVLGIYFGERKGKFKKVFQSNTFIINRGSPTMDEPFKELGILPSGELQINFYIWQCRECTSWSTHKYQFKYQSSEFELVRYEESITQRISGDETTYQVDFQKGIVTILTTESEEENNEPITDGQIKRFELQQLQSIKSLGEPFKWLFQNLHI
ncbi:hypothetical protein [Algoriphagus zhangzhouensis]|uniref:Uncharacterized protein n=1 Tax=Algoriphagus zhangzhouensis TaxID=1073327 RepID=A0A1M7ZHC9_9BACT|nr:hypothetical protein [Algoriphagus zhangzhouensis]TDY44160.1 hypothetical protein A8938_3371 [Algoriphagus zhangzhouensis]SHO64311.1 hypothetical protein SAMN04488108_3366 [Algoriphagus zhangzhouensis]